MLETTLVCELPSSELLPIRARWAYYSGIRVGATVFQMLTQRRGNTNEEGRETKNKHVNYEL